MLSNVGVRDAYVLVVSSRSYGLQAFQKYFANFSVTDWPHGRLPRHLERLLPTFWPIFREPLTRPPCSACVSKDAFIHECVQYTCDNSFLHSPNDFDILLEQARVD